MYIPDEEIECKWVLSDILSSGAVDFWSIIWMELAVIRGK